MINTNLVFEEFADTIATLNPEQVLALNISPASQERLESLLLKSADPDEFTEADRMEIEHFMIVDQIVSLARTKAIDLLAEAGKA